MTKYAQRFLWWGCLLLPLACWPGLPYPFSTPKTWLLVLMSVAALKKPGTPRGGEWLLIAWVGALGLSALLAPYASPTALLLAAVPIPLWWMLRDGRLSAARIRSALLWGSAVESALALLQYGGLDPLRFAGWESFASARMRVYGTMGNPDFVAAWLCATLPLWGGPPSPRGSPWRRWAGLALQLAAIVATGSRVLLVALPAAVALLALRRAPLAKWAAAGALAAAALLWLSPSRPLEVTLAGRQYLARIPATHWREVPPAGYGPGSFGMQFAKWQVDWLARHGDSPFAGPVDHPHNDYLEFFIEYGPAGLAAFLAFCGWVFWRGKRAPAEVWACAAALLAIALVDFPFHRPAEWELFWLLMGMLARGTID